MIVDASKLLHILPRLDCGQCGYGGCKPYAQAMADNTASIDRCPPGGVHVVQKLANALNIPQDSYLKDIQIRSVRPLVAHIHHEKCVGCFKCTEVCPVDAVIGARGMLHNIITSECNGCGLCVPACPVDCISLVPSDSSLEVQYLHRDVYHARQEAKKLREKNNYEQQQTKKMITLKYHGASSRRAYIDKAQQRVENRVKDKNDRNNTPHTDS